MVSYPLLVPPVVLHFSITVTLAPFLAAATATVSPTVPPPIIAISVSSCFNFPHYNISKISQSLMGRIINTPPFSLISRLVLNSGYVIFIAAMKPSFVASKTLASRTQSPTSNIVAFLAAARSFSTSTLFAFMPSE
jgi:hypothetical protein